MNRILRTLASITLFTLPLASGLAAQSDDYRAQQLAAVETQLSQMKKQGATESMLLIIKAMGLYQVGLPEEAAAQVDLIEKELPTIMLQEGKNSPNVLAAEALIQLKAARQALDADDIATAQEKLGRAFFYMPEVTNSIASAWVNDYHEQQDIKSMQIPMDLPLENAAGGTSTLASLVGDSKALYVSVWATWCPHCMAAIPDLKKRAAEYTPKGITFVGLNTEGLQEAQSVAKKDAIDMNILHWLVEAPGPLNEDGLAIPGPMLSALHVTAYPTAYLISPEGKVLWKGHPSESALTSELNKLAQD